MALDNFIPEIWSTQLLTNLHNDLVFGRVFNTDYQGEIAQAGDTVRIHSVGPVSVSNYTKNNDHAAPEALDDSEVVLNITESKMFNFQVDNVDRVQQSPKMMAAAMREAAFGLANVADSFLATTLNAGTPAANTLTDVTANSSSTWGALYEAFVDLGVVLDENNCPVEGRYAVLSPRVYGVLLKDPRFVSFGTNENRGTISNRSVGTINQFEILVSNKVPAGDGTNPQVLAGHVWAATYAQQISQVKAYEPEKRFADAVKGLHLYGAKIVRPSLLAKVEVDV
jgi:N4-gp56 family major capsid protein